LKLYRRRWKASCSDIHYSNRYNFHPSGAKSMGKSDRLPKNTSIGKMCIKIEKAG